MNLGRLRVDRLGNDVCPSAESREFPNLYFYSFADKAPRVLFFILYSVIFNVLYTDGFAYDSTIPSHLPVRFLSAPQGPHLPQPHPLPSSPYCIVRILHSTPFNP